MTIGITFIMLAILIASMALATLIGVQARKMYQGCTYKTLCICIKSEEKISPGEEGDTIYYDATFAYEVYGRQYILREKKVYENINVNDIREIVYNPNNPAISYVNVKCSRVKQRSVAECVILLCIEIPICIACAVFGLLIVAIS